MNPFQTQFDWLLMTEPIVSPPYNPGNASEASLAAIASGKSVHLSTNFGATWLNKTVDLPNGAEIYGMVFASGDRFFVGTTTGEVFRADKSAGAWRLTRIDNSPAGPLPLQGLISDIGIDWEDPTRS